MSEPRVITYRTRYGNRERKVVASDAYNAAARRMSLETGERWRCVEYDGPSDAYLVRRFKRIRKVKVP